MAKNLMIIESPNKIETLSHFLPKDFKVIATVGHIRDLGKTGPERLGFDEKTLAPNWIVPKPTKKELERINKDPTHKIKTKQQIIDEIRQEAKKADTIWLASDPDREGEAISWHVYEVLDKEDREKTKRITFNEITEGAVLNAIEHPRKIDINWVHSQFSRRILDRLIGFKLSRITQQKMGALSAGRVQTVALKYIYDREQEIKEFTTKKWFKIVAQLKEVERPIVLREINPKLKNVKIFKDPDSTENEKFFVDHESAQKVVDDLIREYTIYAIDEPTKQTRKAKVPYKTSTMQQEAINVLGWGIGDVTGVAQKLYEGIKIKGKHTALISYPRTDSIRMADTFITKLKKFITEEYGAKYYSDNTERFTTGKKENVQDAHEGIRVIDPYLTPAYLKPLISQKEYKLYKLIWMRTVASMMPDAVSERTVIRIINNENKFYTHTTKQLFDGFKKVWALKEENDNVIDISELKVGHKWHEKVVEIKECQKSPPPRYTQASLIKKLDDDGIGRPSTYKMMAQTIIDRVYTELINKAYHMTPTGDNVIIGLSKYFKEIVDPNFTKNLEEHLDEIAAHEEGWKEWILEYIPKFNKEVDAANNPKTGIKHLPPENVFDENGKMRMCPKCGKPLVKRFSRKSKKFFIGCSNWPDCDYVEYPGGQQAHKQKILEELCPWCGKPLAERFNHKKGEPFIACTGFPKCHYLRPFGISEEEYAKIREEKLAAKKAGKKWKASKKEEKELKESGEAAHKELLSVVAKEKRENKKAHDAAEKTAKAKPAKKAPAKSKTSSKGKKK